MQSSAYNNPLFAQGLSGLIQGMIGNPGDTAKNEVMASEALLNNQTAQYREAIGETGLSGDLASMMIRALQAGPQYSGNAPKIGDAAIRMGQKGFGSPALSPQNPIAQMIQQVVSAPRQQSAPAVQSAPAIVPTAPAASNMPPPPDEMATVPVLNEARMAVAAGASRAMVSQRLAELGIDPGRL